MSEADPSRQPLAMSRATRALCKRARELERRGKTRAQIAEALGVDKARGIRLTRIGRRMEEAGYVPMKRSQ